MKRAKLALIGVTSLVVMAGSLAVAAPTYASPAHATVAKKKYCNQIKNPIARQRCKGVKPNAILAQAVKNAQALAAAYAACQPKSSAHCQALLQQAKAAIAQEQAIARQFGLPAANVPITGAGGTAPVAGVAGSVVGIPSAAGASQSVSALPATGGAAEMSGGASGLPALPVLLVLALVAGALTVRRGLSR
jgi:hypothetical protein